MVHARFQAEGLGLVFFDMIGTTVDDRTAGNPLVISAMIESFAESGYRLRPSDIAPHRGKEKQEMIRLLLAGMKQDSDCAIGEKTGFLYELFMNRLREGAARLREIEGTGRTFRFLQDRGIRVAVGSGLPTEMVDRIVGCMGWRAGGLVDCAVSAEQAGAGRPAPGMIRHVINSLGIQDPKRVLKVGDTVADIEEGKNAGTWTAAVLSGTQPEKMLKGAGPDLVLQSVAEIPRLFTRFAGGDKKNMECT